MQGAQWVHQRVEQGGRTLIHCEHGVGRSVLLTCAVLTALYRPEQLRFHLGYALDNGVTKDELVELMTHAAFYAGHPSAVTAGNVAYDVFEQRGLL